jgi:hypothetical protein
MYKLSNYNLWLREILMQLKIHLIPLSLILIIVYRNAIPEGYVVAGGDFLQWFNFSRQLSDSFSIWANESIGYPHLSYSYGLFYAFINLFVETFALQLSSQSTLYYLLFLLGSYFSFYLSLSCTNGLLGNLTTRWKTVLSVGYALNIFTFYNFFGLWGFSPFFFLYVLIPLIFGYTFKYFSNGDANLRTLGLIGVIFFLVNIPNGNFAFFVSLNLVLIVFIAYTRVIFHPPKKFVNKLFLYYFVVATTTAWSVIPQLIELLGKGNAIAEGETAISLADWVLGQAAKFPDPFLIVNNHQVFLNYPFLLLSSCALLMAAVVSLILLSNSKHQNSIKKYAFALFSLYLFVIFLLNKGSGIVPADVTVALFANTIMGSIRSFHKTIVFLPFLLYFIVYIGLANSVKHTYIIKLLVFLAVLIPVIYFIRGGILTNYSFHYAAGEADYKTSPYSPLIKIPANYVDVANTLNQDKSTHRILSAPYFLADEIYGWRSMPKLKYTGTANPIWSLIDAPLIDMNNTSLFKMWNFGKDWSLEKADGSSWLLQLTGLINVKYIMLHKDIEKKYKLAAIKKFSVLEQNGLVKMVAENRDLVIYKVNDKYFFPRVYAAGNPVILNKSISEIKEKNITGSRPIDSIVVLANVPATNIAVLNKLSLPRDLSIEFKRITSTKYRVVLHKATGEFILVLSEAFNARWNIYSSTIDNVKSVPVTGDIYSARSQENTKLTGQYFKDILDARNMDSSTSHIAVNGNANGWIFNVDKVCGASNQCVKNPDGSYEIEVELQYSTQNILEWCLVLSTLFLGVCFYMFIFSPKGGKTVI